MQELDRSWSTHGAFFLNATVAFTHPHRSVVSSMSNSVTSPFIVWSWSYDRNRELCAHSKRSEYFRTSGAHSMSARCYKTLVLSVSLAASFSRYIFCAAESSFRCSPTSYRSQHSGEMCKRRLEAGELGIRSASCEGPRSAPSGHGRVCMRCFFVTAQVAV